MDNIVLFVKAVFLMKKKLMNEVKQEVISIKRSVDSLDGWMISYLKSDPLKLGLEFSQIVIDTLRAYWLPFVVSSRPISPEELRRIAILAVNQLEGQACVIREVFDLRSRVTTPETVIPPTAANTGINGTCLSPSQNIAMADPTSTQAINSQNLAHRGSQKEKPMNEVKQEVISIKRSVDSLDAWMISYLKSDPLKLDLDFSQIVINTLRAYWLPFVVSSLSISPEELRRIAIWAVNQLESQASVIREVFALPSRVTTVGTVIPPTAANVGINGTCFSPSQNIGMADPTSTQAINSQDLGHTGSQNLCVNELEEPTSDYESNLMPLELCDEMTLFEKTKATTV